MTSKKETPKLAALAKAASIPLGAAKAEAKNHALTEIAKALERQARNVVMEERIAALPPGYGGTRAPVPGLYAWRAAAWRTVSLRALWGALYRGVPYRGVLHDRGVS